MKNIEHQWSNITTERRAYTEQNHPFTSILSPHLVATKCLKRVLLGTAPVSEHLQQLDAISATTQPHSVGQPPIKTRPHVNGI